MMQSMMVAALLITGMGVAVLGSVKVPMARRLEIDEARVGGLVSLFGFTVIPVNFLAGILTDHIGAQAVLLGGSILFTLSLTWLGLAKKYVAALIGVILLSAGWSLLINVVNVLTPAAFPDASKAFATNFVSVFFGLGAFLTPVAIAWLLRATSFSRGLALAGCVALVPALLSVGVAFPSQRAADASGSLADVLTDPMLWWCGLAMFFYGPLEASMAAWTTTYLQDQGVRSESASSFLSAFWLAYVASRLATALLIEEGHETILVLVLSLACVAVLAGIVVNRDKRIAIALVIAAGAVFGPIFPTLMAVLLEHFPETSHGRAVGLFFAIGGTGWAIIPILLGIVARRTTLQRGFAVAVLTAVGLSVMAGILATR